MENEGCGEFYVQGTLNSNGGVFYEVLSACEELKRPSSWCIRTLIDISSFLRVRFQVWVPRSWKRRVAVILLYWRYSRMKMGGVV